MDDLERIRKKIRRDTRFKSIRTIYKTNTLFQITVDEYRKEIRDMFRIRQFRSLSVRSPQVLNKLAEAIVQDQSYRSRMTELLSQVHTARKTLIDMLSHFHDYALAEYGRDLKMLGAAKERSAFLNDVLSTYHSYCEDLDNLMLEIDTYIKDIDKAGYAAKNLVEVLHLMTLREGNLPTPKVRK